MLRFEFIFCSWKKGQGINCLVAFLSYTPDVCLKSSLACMQPDCQTTRIFALVAFANETATTLRAKDLEPGMKRGVDTSRTLCETSASREH